MSTDAHIIDRIVAGVLTQLAAVGDDAQGGVTTETPRHGGHADEVGREATPTAATDVPTIAAKVVTEAVLLDAWRGQQRVAVPARAIVTPAAWDAARERGVEIIRQSLQETPRGSAISGDKSKQHAGGPHETLPVSSAPMLLVIRSTEASERLWSDMQSSWRRELLGCPDDAAQVARSAICRGEASTVVILAEQTHRAACLANRNDRVKAVAARDAGDVRTIKKQLRANVWCIDPTGRSWFELKNLFKAISDN